MDEIANEREQLWGEAYVKYLELRSNDQNMNHAPWLPPSDLLRVMDTTNQQFLGINEALDITFRALVYLYAKAEREFAFMSDMHDFLNHYLKVKFPITRDRIHELWLSNFGERYTSKHGAGEGGGIRKAWRVPAVESILEDDDDSDTLIETADKIFQARSFPLLNQLRADTQGGERPIEVIRRVK